MAAIVSGQIFRRIPRRIPELSVDLRLLHAAKSAGISLPLIELSRKSCWQSPVTRVGDLKLALRLNSAERNPATSPEVDVKGLVDFLYEDLPHLFDDQGIDPTMYDEEVKYRDPITKHDTIGGYLFNIQLLKILFRPDFQLHFVEQVRFVWTLSEEVAQLSKKLTFLLSLTSLIKTGPYEITTRWTMTMKSILLPWKPELVFTGISIMGINPKTQKFCRHLDLWDSISNNEYFSFEGLWDVIRQLRMYKTPDLETPKCQTLKRTADYEVRKYSTFVVAETKGESLSGSRGFNDVAGCIFGKNSSEEKIPMTTPVFTQAFDTTLSNISIQIVIPSEKNLSSLPDPTKETVSLRRVEGGIAAAFKFSGKPTEEIVAKKEQALRSALLRDGLKPKQGCLLARYNDPGRTWSFVMRNEVLIWIEDFKL